METLGVVYGKTYKLERLDMKIQETNVKFKDTLFRKVFRDDKRAIELYCAISGTKVEGEVTIYPDDEFWMRQNDLSFNVDDQLVVVCEHQSTLNPNMPLRQLLYFSQILSAQVVGNDKLYSRTLVEIPTPKFFVLYNGAEAVKSQELKLSDAFRQKGEAPMCEVVAKVIDIKWEIDKPVLLESPSLEGYSYLIAEINKNISAGMPRDKAIGAAIETCIHEGKLKEFLVENYEEVAAMLNFEYSYETHLNVMREEGIQLGRQEGRQEERYDIIAKMVKNGISVKQICEITGFGEEEINSIANKKE